MPFAVQDVAEFGRIKRTFSRFLDHDLAVDRDKLGQIAVPASPAIRIRPIGPGVADPEAWLAAIALGRREIGKIRLVALHRVDDRQPGIAKPLKQSLDVRDDPRDPADIVAEARAETAGLGEIALHIDHDDGAHWSSPWKGEWLRLDVDHDQ